MRVPSQSLRYLQIETSLGADALILTKASGHERLGGLFEISLELTSQTGDINLDDLLGTAATMAILNSGETRKGSVGHTRYFNGYFSRISFAGFGAEGQYRYFATLVPWLWFLTRTSDCRIFQQKSVPEIIEEVFRDSGFSDFRKDLRGSYSPREFCVQYRETDFNFVSRLLEQEGIYYFFEHENGSHKMVLCDNMVCHTEDPQHEILRFIGGAEARERRGTITDWSFAKQVKPGKFAHNDFNFVTPLPDPNLRLLARSSAPEPQKPAAYEIYDNPGGYGDIGEGNRYARLRMEELITDRDVAHARTDIMGIKAGCRFELQAHPAQDQNREYLVTSVRWNASEGGYGSGSGGGDFFDCDFQCIPTTGVFRTACVTPRPKIEGPQTATVCGPPDQEIYVDEHGRVKVQFHWDRYGNADAESSCWIRVSQPWAGSGFGGIAIPRIGHEVIVEFIEADPDRPIITGRVYNGSARTPYALPEHATRTTLKSDTSPHADGFNEFRIEDKKGSEQIFIHGQRNMELRVRNRIRETNGADRHEKVGKSLYVTVDEEENTHIVKKHYEMTEESHLTIKGDHSAKIEKNLKTYVGDSHVLNATDAITETSQSVSVKTNQLKMQGAAGAYMLGQQIVLEGTTICLKSGGNFITISPAGVQIQGTMVMINSGGASMPAQSPAAAPEISVLEPLDAEPASTANPGRVARAGRGIAPERTRGGGPVRLHRAPDYTPPPDTPPPTRTAPPAEREDTPCSVDTLDVSCGHSPARHAVNGRLQIVPDQGATTITTALTIRQLVQVSVQQKGRGNDTINVRMTNHEGSNCQKQVALTQGGAPADSEWRGGTSLSQTVPTPGGSSLWLDGVDPTVYHAYGRGRPDESPASVQIEAFPCYGCTGSVNINFFRDAANAINDGLKRTVRRGLGAIEIEPQLTLPSGQMSFSCGWKEHTDWRAFYAWELQAGLEPLIGVALQVRPNLLAIAGTAVGIPPQLTNYAASIFVHLMIGGSVGISGRVAKVGPENMEGGIRANGQVFLELGLGARVGDENLLRAELTGSGRTGITLSTNFSYRSGPGGGLMLQPQLDWNGLSVTVRLVTHAFGAEMTNNELVTWQVFDNLTIWQPPQPWYIIANDS